MAREYPRGYGSEESASKVKKALSLVSKRYPELGERGASKYLAEVGAGRILALAAFSEPDEPPPPKKKAKKAAPKKAAPAKKAAPKKAAPAKKAAPKKEETTDAQEATGEIANAA